MTKYFKSEHLYLIFKQLSLVFFYEVLHLEKFNLHPIKFFFIIINEYINIVTKYIIYLV